MKNRYAFPINCKDLMSDQKLILVDEETSIHGHLHTLLMTHIGHHRFDADYGCELWNHEFVVEVADPKNNIWKAQMEEAMLHAVKKYEKRLNDKLQLKIEVEEHKQVNDKGVENITKKFKVRINNMYLKQTDELISDFESSFVFSPITLE